LSVPEDRGLVPVEVAVYDLRGRRVRSLIRGSLRGGDHDVTWNGRDEGGRAVASGVYFARARVGGEVSLTRLVVRR
jgi:flagellar hook assembly protein FlgD